MFTPTDGYLDTFVEGGSIAAISNICFSSILQSDWRTNHLQYATNNKNKDVSKFSNFRNFLVINLQVS